MFDRIRHHLTYSNVTATVALFIALGGSSYAALQLTGRDIRNDSLTGRDVRNTSLTGADLGVGSVGGGELVNLSRREATGLVALGPGGRRLEPRVGDGVLHGRRAAHRGERGVGQ